MLSEAKALIYIANINGETRGNYLNDQAKFNFFFNSMKSYIMYCIVLSIKFVLLKQNCDKVRP